VLHANADCIALRQSLSIYYCSLIVQELLNLKFEEVETADVWQEDVKLVGMMVKLLYSLLNEGVIQISANCSSLRIFI
jgi:hypothetical protein